MQVKKQQLEPDMEQQTGSKLGKEHVKAVLSPCLFNLYAEYIMRNTALDEAQGGIKIAGRNISNLRYAVTSDDITLITESKELKSLLMKVKEENEKAGLKLSIQTMKIMASIPITLWQIDGKTMETVTDFIFGGLQNHCRWRLQARNEKMLASWKKSYDKPRQHSKKQRHHC